MEIKNIERGASLLAWLVMNKVTDAQSVGQNRGRKDSNHGLEKVESEANV